MADQVNEFQANEFFTEKVLGITVFNGNIVIAREDGVFMQGEDTVFRRVDPIHAQGENLILCHLPNVVTKC